MRAARGGHAGPHLGEDDEEGGLAHEHALAAHVRPGEDDHLLRLRVESEIVGGEGTLAAHLEHGMAPVRDLEDPCRRRSAA